jgi:hypothetical protein
VSWGWSMWVWKGSGELPYFLEPWVNLRPISAKPFWRPL